VKDGCRTGEVLTNYVMAATLWRRGHTALDYTFVHRYKFEVLQESFRPILHSLIPSSSEILLRKIAGPAKSP